MPGWLQDLLALLALLVLAPLIAWSARRYGARVRGSLGLAGILLGLGEAVDPPSQRMIEAKSETPRDGPAPGDPPAPGRRRRRQSRGRP